LNTRFNFVWHEPFCVHRMVCPRGSCSVSGGNSGSWHPLHPQYLHGLCHKAQVGNLVSEFEQAW
jgi:hypothetical protein